MIDFQIDSNQPAGQTVSINWSQSNCDQVNLNTIKTSFMSILNSRFIMLILLALFTLAGCVTPEAWKYAKRQANEQPTYRGITDVYFAAFREPDQLRLCVLAPVYSTEEPSPATLKINLEKISKSLAERGETRHDNTNRYDNSIGVGSKLINKCEPTLQDAEELVPIVRIPVEGTDLNIALQQLAPEELTVFVLEQDGKSHFVIGSNDQDFPGLNREAFSAHAKDNASKAGYVLVPFAVVVDAVILTIFAFACLLTGGNCY